MRTRTEVLSDIDNVLTVCKGCDKRPYDGDTSDRERYCLKECNVVHMLEPYRKELLSLSETNNRKVLRIGNWRTNNNNSATRNSRYKVWQKEEIEFLAECKKQGKKQKQIQKEFYYKFKETLSEGSLRGILMGVENHALLSMQ